MSGCFVCLLGPQKSVSESHDRRAPPMSPIYGSDKEPQENALLAREFDRFGTVMAFPKKAGLLLSGMSF